MGRCIYGGIYDPENDLSDEHGFRKDVVAALRDIDIPVIRYPGGNFVATYHCQSMPISFSPPPPSCSCVGWAALNEREREGEVKRRD